MKTSVSIVMFFLIYTFSLQAQQDTRYDAGMNLPFNEKAGDVNPQTGNLTLSVTDLSLPGRAGMSFSFGRVWSLNQSNVYAMYRDPNDGSNRLGSQTIEKYNQLGVGWSSSLPYVFSDASSGANVLNLVLGGAMYQIDQTGMRIDNPLASNILWYDLKDMRFYQRATGKSVSYAEFGGSLTALQTTYGVTDAGADRSEYVLILKTNEKYWFRADGRLMMQEDRTGLNRIWYFYDGESKLKVAVDTMGREIRFQYGTSGNLTEIAWDVTVGKKASDGSRVRVTETRSVSYAYESVETSGDFPLSAALKNAVVGYKEPFVLVSQTDPMANVTRYSYSEGLAGFTYDKYTSHSQNAFILLTNITDMWTADGKYKSRRCFEYEMPARGPYTKYFYTGYMEYYKISREYLLDRHGREMKNTTYRYYDNGENGNSNCYTAVVQQGRVTATYVYSLASEASKYNVLDHLETKTEDGFSQVRDFVYDANRTKTLEEVYRGGTFAYRDKFLFDEKGNLKRSEDRAGLVTVYEYDDKYSIPLREVKTVTVEGVKKNYESRNVINALGQVIKQIIYLENPDGTRRAVEAAKITYDAYGNPVAQTNAQGVTIHTVYDAACHAFPVKIWQAVGIDSWSAGGTVHDNWLTDPDGTKKVIIRSWQVFNSDGTVWIEIDNEGYAIEHYFDKNNIEIETVNPNPNDVISFALPVDAVWDAGSNDWLPGSGDLEDFFADYLANDIANNGNAYLNARADNPGARMTIYYQDDFILTEADIDKAQGHVKRNGAQKDGLGNVEEEIAFGEPGETHVLTGYPIHARKVMTYDNLGRMVGLTDPDATASDVVRDVGGTPVEKHDKTWIVSYDDLGRTKSVLYPETVPGKTYIKVRSYNDKENSVTTLDPERRKVKERRDWSGNLVEVAAYGVPGKTPASEMQIYAYAYDELNRKVRFTDPQLIVTGYAYDERNLLVKQDFGATGRDIMKYDDLGQLVEKTDRNGHVLAFTYDEMGRNTRVIHYETAADQATIPPSPSRTVRTVYDNRGNAVRVDSEQLIEHYLYDQANRVVSLNRRLKDQSLRQRVSTVWGGDESSQVLSFAYTYNDAGMVTAMTYPDGSVHKYAYDATLARLQEIAEGLDAGSAAPFVTGLDYTPSGVVERMNYSNGTYQTWDFDNRKRIKHIGIMGPAGAIEEMNYVVNGSGDILGINQNEYAYDGFDRIVGAKTKLPENTDNLKLVKEYFGTYQAGDPIDGKNYLPQADLNSDGRINGQDHAIASSGNDSTLYDIESFTYDKNGNRTKLVQNGDEYTYEYGDRNQLARVYVKKQGTFTRKLFIEYAYDPNGNTVRRTIHREQADETVTFEYDTMNRVIRTDEGAKWTMYKYDNAGNRFVKECSDGSLSLYLRHGQIAVAMDVELPKTTETTFKGKLNRYVLSGDLLAGRVTKTVAMDDTISVAKSWYHLDHLNSTKCITNASAVVEVSYVYRAFGEQLRRLDAVGQATTDKAKYSYGGKELDEDTNLYYFNARYYDATIGRFISVDPVQDGSNWYVYCANNPLSFKDPTGLIDIKQMRDLISLPEMYFGSKQHHFFIFPMGGDYSQNYKGFVKIRTLIESLPHPIFKMQGAFNAVAGQRDSYIPGTADPRVGTIVQLAKRLPGFIEAVAKTEGAANSASDAGSVINIIDMLFAYAKTLSADEYQMLFHGSPEQFYEKQNKEIKFLKTFYENYNGKIIKTELGSYQIMMTQNYAENGTLLNLDVDVNGPGWADDDRNSEKVLKDSLLEFKNSSKEWEDVDLNFK